MSEQTSKIKILRFIWVALGSISFIIGTIGVFLPLLPTFPFYLFTLFCFTKGSKRLQQRFINSSLYKNTVEDYLKTKSIALKTKFNILISLTIFMGIGAYFMKTPWALAILGLIWIAHIIFIGFVVKTKKVNVTKKTT